MIEMSEKISEVRKMRYTTQAPDGTQVVADMNDATASITYGGTALTVPLDALPVVTALSATLSAAIPPVAVEPDPEPEP